MKRGMNIIILTDAQQHSETRNVVLPRLVLFCAISKEVRDCVDLDTKSVFIYPTCFHKSTITTSNGARGEGRGGEEGGFARGGLLLS